jgi:hypothetical protein
MENIHMQEKSSLIIMSCNCIQTVSR